jgi:hypothetical protein
MEERVQLLNAWLKSGWQQGERLGALSVFERTATDSPSKIIASLIVGQRREIRRRIFAHMATTRDKVDDAFSVALVSLCFPVRALARLVVSYLDLDGIVILQIPPATWDLWGVSVHVRCSIQDAILWAGDLGGGMEETLQSREVGIWPRWTRNAYQILKHRANLFLAEDGWVRRRWSQLLRYADIPPEIGERLLAQPERLPISLYQLTCLLWRLRPTGVSPLSRGVPLTVKAFISPAEPI